jgi:hypothetical protein
MRKRNIVRKWFIKVISKQQHCLEKTSGWTTNSLRSQCIFWSTSSQVLVLTIKSSILYGSGLMYYAPLIDNGPTPGHTKFGLSSDLLRASSEGIESNELHFCSSSFKIPTSNSVPFDLFQPKIRESHHRNRLQPGYSSKVNWKARQERKVHVINEVVIQTHAIKDTRGKKRKAKQNKELYVRPALQKLGSYSITSADTGRVSNTDTLDKSRRIKGKTRELHPENYGTA